MSESKKKKVGLKANPSGRPETTDTMLEMKAIPFFIDSSGSEQPKLDLSTSADDDLDDFDDQDDTVRIEGEDDDLTATDFLDDSES